MLSASIIDNASPSYGAIRVLAPFPEIETNNISQIQEVYKNLPQLGKSFILPLHYNTLSQQDHRQINGYPEIQIVSPYSSKFYTHTNRNADFVAKQRIDFNKVLTKRDGWIEHSYGGGGWDAGHGHGHGHGHQSQSHHGNSPALSALALLGFMFFLNLIQTSLQTNRQMMVATALNATTLGIIAGRSRDKRAALPYTGSPETLGSVVFPTFVRMLENFGDLMKTLDRPKIKTQYLHPTTAIPTNHRQKSRHVTFTDTNSPVVEETTTKNSLEIFKMASLPCLKLLSCKLAKKILHGMDTGNGLMLIILGKSMMKKLPPQSWTGQIMRAFSKGWDQNDIKCERTYKKCTIIKLFA